MRLKENMLEKFIVEKASWILSKIEYFKCFGATLIDSKGKKYEQCKHEALVLVEDRLEYFNRIYNLEFKKVNIKQQKTRWGSCSLKCNLNFNYKILFLPQDVADYIVVHELCHLKEFNHSRKFWDLVAKAIPDYKIRRQELKKVAIYK